MSVRSFSIGSGLSLRPLFSTVSGGCQVNSDIVRVNQSIYIILSTPVGSRRLVPEFGSRFYLAVFELNDDILADLLQIYAYEALDRWERRIQVTDVKVRFWGSEGFEGDSEHLVNVVISYVLRNSNVPGSYVYPFYREPMPLGREEMG